MVDDFRTRGFIPGGLVRNRRNQQLDIAALPPIVRTLLVTDGTVTKTLEAYFWEPMQIERVEQSLVELDEAIAAMQCDQGQRVLRRSIQIVGADSGSIYTYATSILNLEALPATLNEPLVSGSIGIGELLRDHGLETYRQLVDIYFEQLDEQPGEAQQLVCRSYYIYYQQKPVIEVTEKFPLALYS